MSQSSITPKQSLIKFQKNVFPQNTGISLMMIRIVPTRETETLKKRSLADNFLRSSLLLFQPQFYFCLYKLFAQKLKILLPAYRGQLAGTWCSATDTVVILWKIVGGRTSSVLANENACALVVTCSCFDVSVEKCRERKCASSWLLCLQKYMMTLGEFERKDADTLID